MDRYDECALVQHVKRLNIDHERNRARERHHEIITKARQITSNSTSEPTSMAPAIFQIWKQGSKAEKTKSLQGKAAEEHRRRNRTKVIDANRDGLVTAEDANQFGIFNNTFASVISLSTEMRKCESIIDGSENEFTSSSSEVVDSGVNLLILTQVKEIQQKMLDASTPEESLRFLKMLRSLACRQEDLPIASMLAAETPKTLYTVLPQSKEHAHEVAWILSNLAAGTSEQTRLLLDTGAGEVLENLALEERNIAIAAIWGLANIAGDSATMRDKILNSKILRNVLDILQDILSKCPTSPDDEAQYHTDFLFNVRCQEKPSTFTSVVSLKEQLTTLAWFILNLCRGNPSPQLKAVLPTAYALVDMLDKLWQIKPAHSICVDAAWALSFLSRDPNALQFLIELNAMDISRAIIQATQQSDPLFQPIFQFFNNFSVGPSEVTIEMLNDDILDLLISCASSEIGWVSRDALWCLSNIAASDSDHVHALIDKCCHTVVTELINKGSLSDKQLNEALYILGNMIETGLPTDADIVAALVRENGFTLPS
eukprot:gene7849-7739_t